MNGWQHLICLRQVGHGPSVRVALLCPPASSRADAQAGSQAHITPPLACMQAAWSAIQQSLQERQAEQQQGAAVAAKDVQQKRMGLQGSNNRGRVSLKASVARRCYLLNCGTCAAKQDVPGGQMLLVADMASQPPTTFQPLPSLSPAVLQPYSVAAICTAQPATALLMPTAGRPAPAVPRICAVAAVLHGQQPVLVEGADPCQLAAQRKHACASRLPAQ